MNIKQQALAYHENPTPGKIALAITKQTDSQDDLALAYTPGVAEPVRAIADDPLTAYQYTSKGNLVGVITNGSAVLGLGNVGALASKPVMEGKAVLFKRFADIDVFDLEIDAADPQAFIQAVCQVSPTFGGINLEDIKAPECFDIEAQLKQKLNIPVFHDDQHGTAIVVAAGLLNALEIQGKSLADCKIVCVGAGAAGIASMRLLASMGAPTEHLFLLDSQGLIHQGRENLNPHKQVFAQPAQADSLTDVIVDADVFIGVAKPNLLSQAMLQSMAAKPIIFALSNPEPEIEPALAHAIRNDLIMATGRSDYPNQVNNVLCFPYIFRGALDARASCINDAMMIAAVDAIRGLAHEPVPDTVLAAYSNTASLSFGAEYILPKPLDPRLLTVVSHAVATAAKQSGVAHTWG